MADSKIVLKVVIDDKGNISKLSSMTKGFKDLDFSANGASNSARKLENQLKKTFNGNIPKQIKVTEKEFKSLNNQVTSLTNKNGAATSATLELGRVLSDMPYGIRGVANNLQQLASNLFFMSKATDSVTGKTVGFGGALKNLLGGLIGPAGILIAFQGIIALFDYLSTQTEKASENFKKLGSSVGSAAVDLKILKKSLDEGTISREDANESIKRANEQYKGLNLKLDENNKLTDDSVISIDAKILALERLAKAQALQGLMEEQYAKIGAARAKLDTDLAEKGLDLKKTEARFNELQEKLEGVRGRKRSKITEKFVRENETAAFALIRDFRKIEKEGKQSIASLLSTLTEEGLVQDLFKSPKLTEGFREIAKGLDLPPIFGVEDVYDIRLIEGIVIPAPKFEYEESFFEKVDEFVNKYKLIMGGITDFTNGEFERQKTIEQNKTNVLNEQLNNRLLNENLSKDQRQSIQNQIAINDEALRKKQEDIAKKQFMVNKAFNISSALVDTYSAAMSAYKNTLASPTNILLGPAIALARAKKAAAIASVGGLLQVAAIARQKFQSSAAATPVNIGGGGADSGGGQGDRSFDFNLVGATQGNQVLDAIQGQFNKPVQAYVVSRDMTSQQQLDANIKNQASF